MQTVSKLFKAKISKTNCVDEKYINSKYHAQIPLLDDLADNLLQGVRERSVARDSKKIIKQLPVLAYDVDVYKIVNKFHRLLTKTNPDSSISNKTIFNFYFTLDQLCFLCDSSSSVAPKKNNSLIQHRLLFVLIGIVGGGFELKLNPQNEILIDYEYLRWLPEENHKNAIAEYIGLKVKQDATYLTRFADFIMVHGYPGKRFSNLVRFVLPEVLKSFKKNNFNLAGINTKELISDYADSFAACIVDA